MKSTITKIALCLFVVLTAIACKKEEVTPTTPGTGTGLTPSASNTTFEQTMTVQINGSTWIADKDIEGTTTYSTLFDIFSTMIRGTKTINSSDDEYFMLQMVDTETNGSYDLRSNSGICNILYNDKSYSFDSRSPASNKSHIQVDIINTIQNPRNSNIKYIVANFSGTVYSFFPTTDSIRINGNIRFK